MSDSAPGDRLVSESTRPRPSRLRDRPVLLLLVALFVALTVKQIDDELRSVFTPFRDQEQQRLLGDPAPTPGN